MTPEDIITSPEEEQTAVIPEEEAVAVPEEITEPVEEALPTAEEVSLPEAPELEAAEELSQLLGEPMPEALPEETDFLNTTMPPISASPIELPPESVAPTKTKKNKKKKPHRKPHIALRIPLQFLSFVLSVVLIAAVVATVVVADLRAMTSAGSLKELIRTVISISVTPSPAGPQHAPHMGALANGSVRFDENDATEATGEIYTTFIDEDGNVVTMDGNGNIISSESMDNVFVDENGNIIVGGDGNIDLDDIPEDLLTGGNSPENMGNLVDWIYDEVVQSTGQELEVGKEAVQKFVEESTISDYLSDKLAGFADDFINGTENTEITVDELMGLLEENEELLKSELKVELTEEQKQTIEDSLEEVVVEADLNNTIRQEVNTAVNQVLEENSEMLGGLTLEDIQAILQFIASDTLFHGCLILCGIVLLLLCLLNFYNVPAGLTWAAIPCILGGALMGLPITILESSVDTMITTDPNAGQITTLLNSFLNIFKPIHSAPLYVGIGLLVVSIIWRIIRASKKL